LTAVQSGDLDLEVGDGAGNLLQAWGLRFGKHLVDCLDHAAKVKVGEIADQSGPRFDETGRAV